MNSWFSSRFFYLSIFLACLCLVVFALYLEHIKGLAACPLCVFQRIAFIAIGIIALFATLHGPGKLFATLYSSLISLAAITGAAIAGRQIWLQHLPPDQVPECGPGLEYMLDAFPFSQALSMILTGSGECAEIQWRLLGLSIPEWSLVWFLIFLVAGLVSIFYIHRKAVIGDS